MLRTSRWVEPQPPRSEGVRTESEISGGQREQERGRGIPLKRL